MERNSAAPSHYPFEPAFLYAAFVLALVGGFAVGAHLVFVQGFGFRAGPAFQSLIQIHGHLQLVGWAGLLIIGVSLYFVPRLSHVAVSGPRRQTWILALLVAGLAVRYVSHSLLPYLAVGKLRTLVGLLNLAGALSEWTGTVIYLVTLIRISGRHQPGPKLEEVRLLFRGMALGWLLYQTYQVWLVIRLIRTAAPALDPLANQWSVGLFTALVLLPVCFAVSIRTFPLYLRLSPARWSVPAFALVYFVTVALEFLPPLLPETVPQRLDWSHAGAIARNGLLLWFAWRFGILPSWFLPGKKGRLPSRRLRIDVAQLRQSERNQWGVFDRLLTSAYTWLVVGAVLEGIRHGAGLFHTSSPIAEDATRHFMLLGFVTLLIFGMALRMIPGFFRARRLAYPGLVTITYWLGNLAVVLRVLPLLIPAGLAANVPGGTTILKASYGVSGLVALAAVGTVALNLRRTLTRKKV
jgi:uncharacterized protein involved in response to NO